jgi:hypothetical protein
LQTVCIIKKALIQIQGKVKQGEQWQNRKEKILCGAKIVIALAANLPKEKRESVAALLFAVTV